MLRVPSRHYRMYKVVLILLFYYALNETIVCDHLKEVSCQYFLAFEMKHIDHSSFIWYYLIFHMTGEGF